MAEPPQAVAPDEMPPREYIFVLDVSGSMNGFPLDTAKKLMGDLAQRASPLRHVQRRRVCRRLRDVLTGLCSSDAAESRARAAVHRAEERRRRDASSWPRCNARSRSRANAAASRSIVLVTDGYIEAEADVFDYVRTQLDDANFFAFGIGSSVNRLPHRRRRARRARRAVHRDRTRRGGGGGGAASALHRHARAHRHRRDVHGLRRLRRRAGEGPGPLRQPSDRRLRQVARRAGGIDRDLGHDRSRAVPDVDCRLAGERRRAARRASASVGTNPDRESVGFRSRRLRARNASPRSPRWG